MNTVAELEQFNKRLLLVGNRLPRLSEFSLAKRCSPYDRNTIGRCLGRSFKSGTLLCWLGGLVFLRGPQLTFSAVGLLVLGCLGFVFVLLVVGMAMTSPDSAAFLDEHGFRTGVFAGLILTVPVVILVHKLTTRPINISDARVLKKAAADADSIFVPIETIKHVLCEPPTGQSGRRCLRMFYVDPSGALTQAIFTSSHPAYFEPELWHHTLAQPFPESSINLPQPTALANVPPPPVPTTVIVREPPAK